MNYRHIYHAGGIADVFKHLVLIALLGRLGQKETGFFVADTHAGIGLYDLTSAEAQKTGEWRSGIGRLRDSQPSDPLIGKCLDMIAGLNPDGLVTYPGSPWIIGQSLRPQDRAIACELHPEDHATLRHAMRPWRGQLAVHMRDGYEAVGAFVPPKEKRGLVFIDPPFEQVDEFDRAMKTIAAGYTKFPTGIFALWYPVKDRAAIWRFHEAMIATGIAKLTAIELMTAPELDATRLNGSGVLLVNAPYGITQLIKPTLEELRSILAPDGAISISNLTSDI